jgi:hypothetical protein
VKFGAKFGVKLSTECKNDQQLMMCLLYACDRVQCIEGAGWMLAHKKLAGTIGLLSQCCHVAASIMQPAVALHSCTKQHAEHAATLVTISRAAVTCSRS